MGEPQRLCIVTGESLPQAALLRFALDPNDRIVFDVEAKLPGRGVWLSPKADYLAEAIKRNAFSRALKTQVQLPDDLAERVPAALKAKCMENLHFCRKAGLLVQGFEKVKAALLKEKVALLIHACDAADDGRAKLNKYVDEGLRRCDWFNREELGQVCGRDQAVHMALAHHKLTKLFWQNAQRFAGFMETDAL